MLVLSRKAGEQLVIGDGIVVTVSRISGNRVTLGIDAPNDVKIVRSELQPFVEAPPVEAAYENGHAIAQQVRRPVLATPSRLPYSIREAATKAVAARRSRSVR